MFENDELENFFIDQGGIDSERIVDDEFLLANELLCSICHSVLWRARSCGSCQHLFCQSCIETWQRFHPHSCPYRCSPFDEKRAPPAIQSLLTRLNIRCRNHSFGCEKTVLYENLEEHELNQCEFRTRTCRTCQNDVLIADLRQHAEQCRSTTSVCSFCRQQVDRDNFNEHLVECLENRMRTMFDQILPENNNQTTQTDVFQGYFQRLHNFLSQLTREELNGLDELRRSRNENLSSRISTMFRFLLDNRSKTPKILFGLLFAGIGVILGIVLVLFLRLRDAMQRSIPLTIVKIMIFSGIFSIFIENFLLFFADRWIILFGIVCFSLMSMIFPDLPVDYFRIVFNIRIVYVGFIIIVVLMKILLLIVRFYFSSIPTFITAGALSWLLTLITYHFH